MNEAQERNVVRFIIGNSIPLDEMFSRYQKFCREKGLHDKPKDQFAKTILQDGYQIITIEGRPYVFGILFKGDTRPKPSVYVQDVEPASKEDFDRWMEEHTWKPEA